MICAKSSEINERQRQMNIAEQKYNNTAFQYTMVGKEMMVNDNEDDQSLSLNSFMILHSQWKRKEMQLLNTFVFMSALLGLRPGS